MKKNYIIPSTESVAFYAGSICDTSPAAGMTITGNSDLQYGGQGNNIEPM